MFAAKKFVLIIPEQIASRNLAYVGALIGFQFGRKVPDMVGRDQMVPAERSEEDGIITKRTHLGITTQNLPVLNGLDYAKMRAIRESLREETELLVTDVTDAAAHAASYDEYAQAIATTPEAETNYWGIGIFGDSVLVNKYTQGLKLYGKQSRVANSDPTLPERRLIGDGTNLPTIKFILANNLSGGVLANTAAILGVTYGKLYGDSLFGPDLTDHAGRLSLGLPMVDLSILNGHSDSNRTMREIREKLHTEQDLSVVDVTDATGKTRCYEDYLELAENTTDLETTYWGVGISGPSDLVTNCTAGLSLYISSVEEQTLLKKQEAAKKWEAKKSAAAPREKKPQGKSGMSAISTAATKGGLGWQQNNSALVVSQSETIGADEDAQNGAEFKPTDSLAQGRR